MTMDKVFLIGNLGSDPETKQLANGQSVTSFPLACNRDWRNREGKLESETVWYRISAWNEQGESCQKFLHKGSMVYVEGKLVAKPTVFKKADGEMASSYEVRAANVKFLRTNHGTIISQEEGQDELPY
jgi:single-strand DNA-binding protein